ncbi:MAG TPA: multicopper oxidase domain-containing protein [Jiangellales bacterium]|nr:multicopper oxidase domain-containing protein [Jiangellales bacterium]
MKTNTSTYPFARGTGGGGRWHQHPDRRPRNHLPEHTTIDWHGLALHNDADGVPAAIQNPIAASSEHVYRVTAAQPGRQLGIDTVLAEVLPGGKAAKVAELQRGGRKVAIEQITWDAFTLRIVIGSGLRGTSLA